MKRLFFVFLIFFASQLSAQSLKSIKKEVQNKIAANRFDVIELCNQGLTQKEDADLYLYRGIGFLAIKEYELALQDFNKVKSLNPKAKKVDFYIASVYADLKRYDEAITLCNNELKKNKKFYFSYITRAVAEFYKGDVKVAFQDIDFAIAKLPNAYRAFTIRADFNRLMKNYGDALVDYNRAIELFQGDALVYMGRGLVKNSMGDFHGAYKDFSFSLTIDPKNYVSLYNRAFIRRSFGEVNAALIDFQQLKVWNQNDFDVNFQIGVCYDQLNDFPKALESYSTCINLDSTKQNPYFNRALIKVKIITSKYNFQSMASYEVNNKLKYYERDVEDAIQDFEWFNKLNGDSALVDYFIAQLLNGVYQADEYFDYDDLSSADAEDREKYYSQFSKRAVRYAERACELDPRKLEYLVFKVNIQMGYVEDSAFELTEKGENTEEVEEISYLNELVNKSVIDLDRGIINFPNEARLYYFRGMCMSELGKDAEMNDNFMMCQKMDPKNVDLLFDVGKFLKSIDSFERAVYYFTKIIEVDNEFGDAYYQRGLCYARLKQYKKACEDFKVAERMEISIADQFVKKYCNR